MKTKEESKFHGSKQELIDIYLLTFYKKPVVQPIQEQKKRKLSIKRKAGSVKEILQENPKPLPKLQQLPRVLSQDTRGQELDCYTDRGPNKRYKSVNLTKKFQYLQNKIEQSEPDTYESYNSNRYTYDLRNPREEKQKSLFSQFEKISLMDNYCPKIEVQNIKKVLPKRIIFPKEFSSSGLYKKYFA